MTAHSIPPFRPRSTLRFLPVVAFAFLAGCQEMQLPEFLSAPVSGAGGNVPGAQSDGPLVERDVEAPEVFQVTEAGLWDGRPSLGGVWVAHPEVTDPERVIIRNPSNGKFVIGALFRKERETPGPRLQVSSDAAAALKMVAGQPSNLNVTALRRQAAPEPAPAPAQPGQLDAPSQITAQPLDGPGAPETSPAKATDIAAAALDAPTTAPPARPAPSAAPAAAPAQASASAPSGLAKPFLQIGIFSIEQNAKNTAATMRNAGLVPTIKKGSSSGKTFWRVIVGPTTSAEERATVLKTIKAQGFSDAYAVTN